MIIGTSLEQRLFDVQARVEAAAERSGRDGSSITIIAVSKTVDRATVDEAYALGVRHFGENRVQEAKAKFDEPLPAYAHLHMIGNLQSNKARVAVELFDMIQSVDRASLVKELQRQAEKRQIVQPVLLEINVAGEVQKGGCAPAEASAILGAIASCPFLEVRGVMTMAPLVDDAEEVRPVFRGLRALRDRLQEEWPEQRLDMLSMGMTNDFEVAVEEGATHVRIGRAIFGG